MSTRIQRLSPAKAAKPNSSRVIFWFSLSLTFAVFYGSLSLKAAFSSKYVAQDDARMYVFWLQRFIDPNLLPHDLNVAYHKSIAPAAFTAVYQLMASLGIEPINSSKLLPIMLGVITTVYCFGLCLQIFPVPVAAFISTLLLNQTLWLKDDLISATPRAFLYPLFLAFLYYLLRKALLPVVVAIALLGAFYPPMMFISVGILILRLWRWERGRPSFSPQRSDYLLCVAGIGAAVAVILPFALSSSEFGPTVTAAQAKAWPEFSSEIGRIPYFNDHDPWEFWFQGIHSGIRLAFNPPIVALGLLLPLLLRYPSRFPLAKQVNQNVILLIQILLVSLGLFLAAHALFFHLFLPSRYTSHSLIIEMAITGGIALGIILDAILNACAKPLHRQGVQFLALGATGIVVAIVVLYPNIFWKNFAKTGYFVGTAPALYEFFQHQPKNILIASLAEEANNLPVFSQRSILVGRKYAIPYHVGYYRQMRQRVTDLIRAQYSPNPAVVKSFIQKYRVDFLLLDQKAFTLHYLDNNWFKLFEPARSIARANLAHSHTPVLAQMMKRCSVLETKEFVVLQAKCLSNSIPNINTQNR